MITLTSHLKTRKEVEHAWESNCDFSVRTCSELGHNHFERGDVVTREVFIKLGFEGGFMIHFNDNRNAVYVRS